MKTEESVIDFPKPELCPEVWEKVIDKNGMSEVWQLTDVARLKLEKITLYLWDCIKDTEGYDGGIGAHITGSITSNQYTENSDIDLHLYWRSENPFSGDAEALNKAVRAHFEENFKDESLDDAYIGKHPIEVYFQGNVMQDMMSVGCYDLFSNKWIVGPDFKDQSYNPYSDLYKEIHAKSEGLAMQIRNMILSIYEIAVVLKKNYSNDFGPQVRPIFLSKLAEVKALYEKIRNMRKVYSSPETPEQALQYRQSRKWKVADASFKLFDKYGYMAILKQFAADYELMSGPEIVDAEVVDDILSTVKKYINNPEKLADSDEVNESIKAVAAKMRKITESWKPDFDDKPVNQWGEKWQKLEPNCYLHAMVDDAAKDCQIDLYDDGPKLESLNIDSVHLMSNGNLIVTVFGGANGGGMVGGCNFKYYLCLVRKLLGKLVGCCKPFADAWLIDWDNDCCDDVWTLRFVLQPTDETKLEMLECNFPILQIKESKSKQSNADYVKEFKHELGYKPDYMPKKNFDQASDSIAREYTLEMPTDTEAREIEGDAVMLLVLSDDAEAVKVGKALGDCMLKKTKHDEKTLLKHMREAFLALSKLYSKELAKKNYAEQQIGESSKDMLTIAMLVGMLAIKNICPAATLETQLKQLDKTELRASNPKFKEAVAKATKGKTYNGMNVTNIINCVARTIYAEAKGEGEKGQAAVASVIWNRAGGKCANLVDVVLKDKQFSCWNEKKPGRTDKDYTIKIPIEAISAGKNQDIWNNCVYLATCLAIEEFTSTIGNRNSYMNKAKASAKAKREWGGKLDLKIGNHDFGYLANNDGFKTKNISTQNNTYVIKSGDTLEKIAKANNTTVDALAKKNKLADPNKLKIGQKLIV